MELTQVLDEGLGYHYLDCGVYLRIAPKEVGCVLPSFKKGSGLSRTTVVELQNYRTTYFRCVPPYTGLGKPHKKKRRASKTLCILIRACNLKRADKNVSGEGLRFSLSIHLIQLVNAMLMSN